MPSQKRFLQESGSDLVIGLMSMILHILLMLIFFVSLSFNNFFLRVINRTLATTQLTYWAMTVAMHAVYGGFDVGRKKSKPVISAMISGTVITDLVTYLQLEIMNVNENNNARLTLFGTDFWLLMMCIVLQVLFIILFVRIGNDLYFHFHPPRGCLIILGSPSQEAEIRAKIERYQLQWRVDDAVMYNVPDLESRIQKADVVFLAQVPDGVKFALLKMCYDDRKDVMSKAQLQDIMLCNARPAIVDDAAFLEMEYNKSTLFQRAFKRAGDILISAFCLLITSPLMLVIAILIHAEDKGPVIFRQSRLTLNGRAFTIRKFRTMAVNASSQEFQLPSLEHDPRVTRIGAFLRRWRLDELPQFINILLGDMSLVGPRPEMMSNVIRYKMELPAFVYREKMKAGLTGYAQIEGRYNTSAEDKLMLDMMYIESFSVWLDIKLILRTFTVLFKADSTQGFKQIPGQTLQTEALRNAPPASARSRASVRRQKASPPPADPSGPARGAVPSGDASEGYPSRSGRQSTPASSGSVSSGRGRPAPSGSVPSGRVEAVSSPGAVPGPKAWPYPIADDQGYPRAAQPAGVSSAPSRPERPRRRSASAQSRTGGEASGSLRGYTPALHAQSGSTRGFSQAPDRNIYQIKETQ